MATEPQEERAVALMWDTWKPDSAPLWWCLDEKIKAKFRPEALGIAERLCVELEEWLAEAKR